MPSKDDVKRIVGPILRGTALGAVLGILPGGGAMLASFSAYALEKKFANPLVPFGEGAIEGVAAPEAANNAGAQTSFIPMLTLGIPSNPVMALMIGAMIIQGIQPEPSVMTEQPALFWGPIASMWIGNLMLLVLNLPLIGLWVKMISMPYHLLYPAIIVFCGIGVFSLSNTKMDVYFMAGFGLLGYIFRKIDAEPAPMLLGFILGPMMEEFLRRALLLSKGQPLGARHPAHQRNHVGAGVAGLDRRALVCVEEAARRGVRRGRLAARISDHASWTSSRRSFGSRCCRSLA
jgi:putative tricarboxylic transport membrane protein